MAEERFDLDTTTIKSDWVHYLGNNYTITFSRDEWLRDRPGDSFLFDVEEVELRD